MIENKAPVSQPTPEEQRQKDLLDLMKKYGPYIQEWMALLLVDTPVIPAKGEKDDAVQIDDLLFALDKIRIAQEAIDYQVKIATDKNLTGDQATDAMNRFMEHVKQRQDSLDQLKKQIEDEIDSLRPRPISAQEVNRKMSAAAKQLEEQQRLIEELRAKIEQLSAAPTAEPQPPVAVEPTEPHLVPGDDEPTTTPEPTPAPPEAQPDPVDAILSRILALGNTLSNSEDADDRWNALRRLTVYATSSTDRRVISNANTELGVAREAIQNRLVANRNDVNALTEAALIAEDSGERNNLMSTLNSLIEDPTLGAEAVAAAKKLGEAGIVFRKVIDRTAMNAKLTEATQLAQNAFEADKKKALSIVREILNDDKENVAAWLLFARLVVDVGDPKPTDIEDRRFAIQKVLEIDPNNQEALNLRDFVTGDIPKAPDTTVSQAQPTPDATTAPATVELPTDVTGLVEAANNRKDMLRALKALNELFKKSEDKDPAAIAAIAEFKKDLKSAVEKQLAGKDSIMDPLTIVHYLLLENPTSDAALKKLIEISKKTSTTGTEAVAAIAALRTLAPDYSAKIDGLIQASTAVRPDVRPVDNAATHTETAPAGPKQTPKERAWGAYKRLSGKFYNLAFANSPIYQRLENMASNTKHVDPNEPHLEPGADDHAAPHATPDAHTTDTPAPLVPDNTAPAAPDVTPPPAPDVTPVANPADVAQVVNTAPDVQQTPAAQDVVPAATEAETAVQVTLDKAILAVYGVKSDKLPNTTTVVSSMMDRMLNDAKARIDADPTKDTINKVKNPLRNAIYQVQDGKDLDMKKKVTDFLNHLIEIQNTAT